MGKNRKSSKDEVKAARLLLSTIFPGIIAVLGGEKTPLKIGIDADIYARVKPIAPGLSRRILNSMLQNYTTGFAYLRCLTAGSDRIDLDGNAAGKVSDHDEAVAIETFQRRTAKKAQAKADKLAAMAARKIKRSK